MNEKLIILLERLKGLKLARKQLAIENSQVQQRINQLEEQLDLIITEEFIKLENKNEGNIT